MPKSERRLRGKTSAVGMSRSSNGAPVIRPGSARSVRLCGLLAFRYQVALSASRAKAGNRSALMVPSDRMSVDTGSSSNTITTTGPGGTGIDT